MKSLIRFVVSLLMPIFLIAGGGVIAGWGHTNEWDWLAYRGFGMIGGGILWGLAWFGSAKVDGKASAVQDPPKPAGHEQCLPPDFCPV